MFSESGIRSLGSRVCVLWFIIYGLLFIVNGLLSMDYGSGFMVVGYRISALGSRVRGHGFWRSMRSAMKAREALNYLSILA